MSKLTHIARKFLRRNNRRDSSCPISFSSRARKKLHWTRFISHHGF